MDTLMNHDKKRNLLININNKDNKNNRLLVKVLGIIIVLFVILSSILLYSYSNSSSNNNNSVTSTDYHPLSIRKKNNSNNKNEIALSTRLKALLNDGSSNNNNIMIGNKLHSIKHGSNTIQNVLNSDIQITQHNKKETIIYTMDNIIKYLTFFLHSLHERIEDNKNDLKSHIDIWDLYYNLVVENEGLRSWDQNFLSFLKKQFYNNSTNEEGRQSSSSFPFKRRNDDSVFLSIASYRDENCMKTLHDAFDKAKNPNKLYVGLVQQNCIENCYSGVLVGGKVEPIEPDDNCYEIFCDEHVELCSNGHVRVLHVNETESLGPYTARYFASRLWYGETWFVQLDSHMTFAQDWDAYVISDLKNAPSNYPVITHYPPSHETNLDDNIDRQAQRLCGPIISDSDIDDEIIIMMFSSTEHGKLATNIPKFAPVIAAGFFATTPEFLIDVPFDMFLPWVFTGEEIIMSARFFTHGYDIFAPTRNIIGHIYERRHKPKFWEVFDHIFGSQHNYYNPLSRIIMKRIKYQLEYPECAKDFITPKSLLSYIEDYSMGTNRTLESYLDMATIDLIYKFTRNSQWCNDGVPPPNIPEYQQYAHLYANKKKE